jgi:hypothetical protein
MVARSAWKIRSEWHAGGGFVLLSWLQSFSNPSDLSSARLDQGESHCKRLEMRKRSMSLILQWLPIENVENGLLPKN